MPSDSDSYASCWLAQMRVAAVGRHLERVQDRRERRLGQEREVGVPQAAERVALSLRRLAHHGDDLGVVGGRLDEGHRAERAEAAAERDLLVGREALAAEEQHLVVEDRAADLGDDVVVEVVGQVDAADDRAARPRDRFDGDAPVGVAGRGRGDGDEVRRCGGHAFTLETATDAAQAVLAGTWAPPWLGQPSHGYDGGTSFAGGSV